MTRGCAACRVLLGGLIVVAPGAAGAQGLFRKQTPLDITITTNLSKLVNDRDSTDRVLYPGDLVYKDSTGRAVKVSIALRTRGHFRRQFRNCDFPPLKVEITRAAATNTLFQGNRTLKLASSCRPTKAEYEEYILQEAALYRMYMAITPWSYRVRLAHVTFVDAAGKSREVRSWAFFVEDDGELAERRNAKKFETKGALFDNLEPEKWGYTQLFEYMIGNTDLSVSALHNITLLKDSMGVVHAVPFDFDWSGAVNARYAFPDKQLPIRSVRDRMWRGDCRPAEELALTIAHFQARRAVLDSAVTAIDALAPAAKQRMQRYFADFWTLVENPRRAAAEFKRTCAVGN